MNNTLEYICDTNELKIIDNTSEKIILSMTSWPKRIHNISKSIGSLLNQTITPYKIILNLSEEEFPNKENDFPKDIKDFLNNNKHIIEIYWLKYNTKVWKKIIPTLFRYPKCLIIGVDDDWTYHTDFIEQLCNGYLKYNCPITTSDHIYKNYNYHCGCASLIKYDFFGNGLNLLNDDIFNAGSDDVFYTFAARKNGYFYKKILEFGKLYETFTNEYAYSNEKKDSVWNTTLLCEKALNAEKQFKIWVYTLCYNEMKILPYIVKYWEKYANKVIVYDNESTDGSIEFLKSFPWIEIRTFKSNNEINELNYLQIKNNAWKEAKENNVNFVQVSDLDEVIYSPLNISEILKNCQKDVFLGQWIEIVGNNFPKIINNEYFHRSIGLFGSPQGIPNGNWSKSKIILFNPNTIKESNYEIGAHTASFTKQNNMPIQYFTSNNIVIFHFDKLGIDYLQYKYSKNANRLSQLNKEKGWGFHYFNTDEQKQQEINELLKNKIDISSI